MHLKLYTNNISISIKKIANSLLKMREKLKRDQNLNQEIP